ncbi:MAG: response regulator, partial [Oscillospiraceae bacterium]|nr:response regulator [Oscillospiraceae bacterium]
MHYDCLIVDDEIALSKMTAEYFEMFDVRTQHVDSAASCYAFLKENTADVILLDINLGDGLGFEVCKVIREKYQIPILFISARQSDDDVLIALSVGGDDYVKKPYSLSVLLAKVKVNLKRVSQLRALEAGQGAQAATQEHSEAGAAKLDIVL